MKGMLRKLAVLLVAAALFAPTLSRGILQAQEKELVVYSTIFAEYADKMKAEFEKLNPGVKVYIINPGGTEAMIKKLEAEKGNPQADIMHSGDSSNYLYAKKQGLLQPYAPTAPGFKPTLDIGGKQLALSDKDNYYHVFNMMFTGIMVNEDLVKEKKLPLPKKFIDFILSDQMQLFGAEYLYIPVKKGLLPASNPASLENASAQIKTLLVPDPSLEEKARADIQAKFGEYIRLK